MPSRRAPRNGDNSEGSNPQTKRCPQCGQTLPTSSFGTDRRRRDGLRGWCKECDAGKKRTARARKARRAWTKRDNHLKRKYGISTQQFDALLAHQDGRCAVCSSRHTKSSPLHCDHDHTTGEVRGLLCGPCNRSAGLLGEDPERIARLAAYVRKPTTFTHPVDSLLSTLQEL